MTPFGFLQVLAGEYDKARIRGEMEALNKANAVVVYAQVRCYSVGVGVCVEWIQVLKVS